MKIIFMGTPDFAVPCLEKLIENGYEVTGIVTRPDRPVGRKQSELKPTPVKQSAIEHGIKNILQPEKVRTKEFADAIRSLEPDLIVTAAYGRIITREVLDIPRLGCINVHGSLLPKYRGAAPIQWAIINGDSVTGITTMYMDEGMDTGDILLKKEIPIPIDMTFGELYNRLRDVGADLLIETLKKLQEGTLSRIPQNHNEATTVPMIKKETGIIDWSKSAWEIHNLVRGTNPWPGASTCYRGQRFKIFKTRLEDSSIACEKNGDLAPGTICEIQKDRIAVSTGKGYIYLEEVQLECSRKMSVHECGHNMDEGESFG
jgi:methionyl-tRNA formyltransferase